MIVLLSSSWISWWNVCPSLWIVYVHSFFQIYIFIWSFHPSESILGQKHTYNIRLRCFLYNANDSLGIKLFNFITYCMSFFMECLSSLLLPYIHLYFTLLSINIIFRPKTHIIPRMTYYCKSKGDGSLIM